MAIRLVSPPVIGRIAIRPYTNTMPDPKKISALFQLTPKEAVEYLQGRGQLTPTFSWQDLWQDEHAQQFTVSRLARLDITESLRDGITASVQGDLSRRDWTKNARTLLEKEGWWGIKEVLDPATGKMVTTKFNPARLKLIYDTNTRMAYAAGQWQRIARNKATHPYVRYITKRDEKVRHSHRAWDNLTLPVDHPFWKTHFPPNGWRCRCRAVSMSQAEYDKGLSPNGQALNKAAPQIKTRDWVNKRTGAVERVPEGIDPGFAYNPGMAQARRANLAQVEAGKLAKVSPDMAAAYRKAAVTAPVPFTGQRPGLFELPPVPITMLTGNEFGQDLGKEGLALAADKLLRALQKSDGLYNADTGWLLMINKKSRDKMGDNADMSTAESKAVAGIESLAKHAVVAESHLDVEHHNEFVNAIYRLYAPVQIGGVLYRAKLTVKDFSTTGKPKTLHALAAVEIENAPLGTLPSSTDESALQTAQPTTGRTITITDLLKNARLQDGGKFKP